MRRSSPPAGLWLALWLAGCSQQPTAEPWTPAAHDAGQASASDVKEADDTTGDAATAANTDAGSTQVACTQRPRRAPARRLTRSEYNNTVRDLLGDTTSPANALPSETISNNFGNDASKQAVSSLLAEQYGAVAEAVAARATGQRDALLRLAPCAKKLNPQSEPGCAKSSIERLVTRAWRRPLQAAELNELVELWQATREASDFAGGMAAVIEAVLQSPDFLYRVERGETDAARASGLRPSSYEMATRLSYMYWGTMPDDLLLAAAARGALVEPAQIRAQAIRLLNERARSRNVVRFFFDSLLPISGLSSLSRDSQIFPSYTPHIGALLREETLQYVEREIFDESSSWSEILTQPYSYMNEELAAFYGIDGIHGSELRKVSLDTSQRLGLLTQAGVLAGTAHSNITSPVLRGSFVVQRVLCRSIPLPTGEILAQIKPPEPTSGLTGRDRYSAHSNNQVCRGCHQYMDPVGLALENYDALGLFRTQENGAQIDPAGSLPDSQGDALTFETPIDLVRVIAGRRETTDCFATQWLSYAYGQNTSDLDPCALATVKAALEKSDYSVFSLLVSLTQTSTFLQLPSSEDEP